MTIKEYILNGAINASQDRLEKLISIGAPQIVIDGQRQLVENLKSGDIKLGGDLDVLTNECESVDRKIGRGGKVYYVFNGHINFFPNAKHGFFIKMNND